MYEQLNSEETVPEVVFFGGYNYSIGAELSSDEVRAEAFGIDTPSDFRVTRMAVACKHDEGHDIPIRWKVEAAPQGNAQDYLYWGDWVAIRLLEDAGGLTGEMKALMGDYDTVVYELDVDNNPRPLLSSDGGYIHYTDDPTRFVTWVNIGTEELPVWIDMDKSTSPFVNHFTFVACLGIIAALEIL